MPARTPTRAFPKRDDAVGYVFGFMVAGFIFVAVVGGVLLAGRQSTPDVEPIDSEGQDQDAGKLLDVLVESPGDWSGGADSLDRAGLASSSGIGLDADHLALLQAGGLTAAPNGLVDQDELLASLGLDPNEYQLRLRIQAEALDQIRGGASYPAYNVALIADFDAIPTITVSLQSSEEMELAAQASLDGYDTAAGATDRAILQQIGLTFRDDVYVGIGTPNIVVSVPGPDLPLLPYMGVTLFEGDIYPDDKTYLNGVLGPRLANYDVLVIGTGVAHNSLTSTATKTAIADWVDAGGILLVMGSASASSNWLQPLFHVSLMGDSGIQAPDPNYAMLHEANELQWQSYPHDNLAWDLGDTAPLFTEGLAGNSGTVLAVSRPGSFGGGVLLTTVNLQSLTTALGQAEAEAFLANVLVSFGSEPAQDITVDLGPDIPDDRVVTTAERMDRVLLDDGVWVPVRLQLWLWQV